MLIGYQENKGYNRSDQGKTKLTKKIIKYIYMRGIWLLLPSAIID